MKISLKNDNTNNEEEFVKISKIFEIILFNKTINLDNNFKFNISAPINNIFWHDYYYNKQII